MILGLLVSGGLGFSTLKKLSVEYKINFVMTDNKSIDIINYCKMNNIDFFLGNPRNGRTRAFIEHRKIDVLISINYLFLIENDIISLPQKIAFNIHGSLLPKYRGRTPHVWAIINNERYTGVTAHMINEQCDAGDILHQLKVKILKKDTGNDILIKYEEQYHVIIKAVLRDLTLNKLKCIKQNNSKATFFGKREPNDGKIIWDWQRERIYNWVRALSNPYPGAFTYSKRGKIIIDSIRLVDDGFEQDMPNGFILSLMPIKVKTPNGVIEITAMRESYTIELGEILK